MHLYFYGPPSAKATVRQSYRAIKDALDQTDIYVSTNTEDEQVQVSAELLAETKQSDTPLLERMDAFIIEGTTSDPQVGFLLAQAIAQRKPALYLYQRGTVPQVFNHLSRRELPSYIRVVAYADTVGPTVLDFLHSIEGIKIREVPRLKFTLRITGSIEDYLHFKTHNTKASKADYLREQIEKSMEQDEDWQQYQRKRRST